MPCLEGREQATPKVSALGRENQAKFETGRENWNKKLMTGVSYIEKRNLPGLGCIFLLTSTFNLTIAIISVVICISTYT